MGTDKDGVKYNMSHTSDATDAASMQVPLQSIMRGVESFQIPPSIDWPAARQHFPDNDGQWLSLIHI